VKARRTRTLGDQSQNQNQAKATISSQRQGEALTYSLFLFDAARLALDSPYVDEMTAVGTKGVSRTSLHEIQAAGDAEDGRKTVGDARKQG
jgi:hypothetical protein